MRQHHALTSQLRPALHALTVRVAALVAELVGRFFAGEEGDINWLVVGGIGALVLGLGVRRSTPLHQKRKGGAMGARRENRYR